MQLEEPLHSLPSPSGCLQQRLELVHRPQLCDEIAALQGGGEVEGGGSEVEGGGSEVEEEDNSH